MSTKIECADKAEEDFEECRLSFEQNERFLEKSLRRAEAERDALAEHIAGFCGVCPVTGTFDANDCPRPMEECPQIILTWAALVTLGELEADNDR